MTKKNMTMLAITFMQVLTGAGGSSSVASPPLSM